MLCENYEKIVTNMLRWIPLITSENWTLQKPSTRDDSFTHHVGLKSASLWYIKCIIS